MIKWFAILASLLCANALAAPIVYCTTTPGISPPCLTITYPDVICPAPVPCPACPPPTPCPTCPPPVACPPPTVCVACVPPPIVTVTTAGLTWNAVVAPNLAGYRVYYGTVPGKYNQPLGSGITTAVTNFTVTGLTAGVWYFAVTAYDTLTNESPFSNEVSKVIAGTPPPVTGESPNLTKVTAPNVGKITDALGGTWSLGPKDPAVEGGVEYVLLHNGIGGPALGAVLYLCYHNHVLGASSVGNWYDWNGTFMQNVGQTIPAGC